MTRHEMTATEKTAFWAKLEQKRRENGLRNANHLHKLKQQQTKKELTK